MPIYRLVKNKILVGCAFLVFFLGPLAGTAHANNALILRGLARTVTSAFEIPKTMISHSRKVVFPVGIVTGAVEGSLRTVVGTVAGALDIAQGAAPYAKYMLFFV
jgi:hypothetical protein